MGRGEGRGEQECALGGGRLLSYFDVFLTFSPYLASHGAVFEVLAHEALLRQSKCATGSQLCTDAACTARQGEHNAASCSAPSGCSADKSSACNHRAFEFSGRCTVRVRNQ